MKSKKPASDLVIGLGEIGRPLFAHLKEVFPDAVGYDIKRDIDVSNVQPRFLHICIPYSENFIRIVKRYIKNFAPEYTIIHSTVPIGTNASINTIHSPVLGRHATMKDDLKKFVKWFGGTGAEVAAKHFEEAGFKTRSVPTSEETELLKLMCLAKYGVMLAFTQYQYELCRTHNVLFEHVLEWDQNYNASADTKYQRPLLTPLVKNRIGGHCVIPNTRILHKQHPNRMLAEVLKYE